MKQASHNEVIRAEGLRKTYNGSLTALHGVSLTIAPGECLGIVGESGSGKSTLARCLLTLQPVDGGEIRFEGRPVQALRGPQLRPVRMRMGAVFQNPAAALNPRLRITESLMEPLDQAGTGSAPSFLANRGRLDRVGIAAALLKLVGLPAGYLRAYPHELSGGEKQRVLIARAISTEPALIVLDEPTASLDVTTQSAVLNLLKDLQERLRLSYLFISHDLAAVHFMSHRVMVMKEGAMVDTFAGGELFAAQRHPYTKQLLEVFSA